MKNKTGLTLLELAIMLLVFALAAALCLQGFSRADQLSQAIALEDDALLLARNGAEVLKHTGGDLQAAAVILGGEVHDDTLTLSWQELTLTAAAAETETPLLGRAEISVTCQGRSLCRLTVYYQEGENGA